MKSWLKFILWAAAATVLAFAAYAAHFFWSMRGMGSW